MVCFELTNCFVEAQRGRPSCLCFKRVLCRESREENGGLMGGYRGKKMEGLQLKMPRTKMPAEAQRKNDYADCKESASLL